MQMLGRKDAAVSHLSGEGFYFNKMDEWAASKDLQDQYHHVGDYMAEVVKEQHLKYENGEL